MLNKLCFASLIATSFSLAVAAPASKLQPPTPPPAPGPDAPPPPVCKATGDVMFQIADRVDTAIMPQGAPTWTNDLYESGAWQHIEYDAKGKITRRSSGCLDKTQLATIRGALEHAPWKVEHGGAACAAVSGTYLEYTLRGKATWTQRMCQLDSLDADTMKALQTISKLLDDASRPSAIETSPGKPVR